MRPAFLSHALRDLPRYTSYPTAVRFGPGVGAAEAERWAAAIDPDQPISVYAHIPYCEQLCWYCGCHTTAPNGYDRIAAFARRIDREAGIWEKALGPHAGASHVHFGGGSPNALTAADFESLAMRLKASFQVRRDAEIAIELDPRHMGGAFIAAMGRVGVNRASLGVQTFDAQVQARINRIQPFELLAEGVAALRAAGVAGINFDLMYGLPLQTPERMAETARQAVSLRPDRLAVFGYAHVPWFAKHQKMIRDEELAGVAGRWAQAEAADEVLTAAGYVRIGLDHYALPDDELTRASAEGRMRRNFQGYTTDAAEVLVPLGPSSIGGFRQGFVQNAKASNHWAAAVDEGRISVERGLEVDAGQRLRGRVIERLMCDLTVDVGALCHAAGVDESSLDEAIAAAAELAADGLCRVEGRRVSIEPEARRLMRVTASCFDADLATAAGRHAKAV